MKKLLRELSKEELCDLLQLLRFCRLNNPSQELRTAAGELEAKIIWGAKQLKLL